MNPVQIFVLHGTQAAIAVAIVGLLRHGHARFCRAFTAYLAVGLAYSILVSLWPGQFYVLPVWISAQLVLDTLKIAAGIELGYWLFLGFPGAGSAAKSSLFLLLLGILVAVLVLPHEPDEAFGGWMVSRLTPTLQTTAVTTFTALTFFLVWYHLPIHPIHRAIMIGFVPYLTVYTTVLRAVTVYGWSAWLVTLEPTVYLVAATWWAWAAWQPAPEVSPVIAALQPWRAQASPPSA